MSAPEVSHGRGGAGNINPDSTPYVDGEITRQGEEGSQNAGPYSTGRGGGGNIGEPGKDPGLRTDKDVVPAAATRKSEEEPFHTGRGGRRQRAPDRRRRGEQEEEGGRLVAVGRRAADQHRRQAQAQDLWHVQEVREKERERNRRGRGMLNVALLHDDLGWGLNFMPDIFNFGAGK
ncbi:uncharacterized protein PG986_013165 [Apiospora aurea]|uniref:Uncharacterized protein n=1 Tax=Apiospora aurea TaxID=335848 RepID=A0ABR1PV34_9PEZI